MFRRRQVWLPTLWGTLALAVPTVLVLVLVLWRLHAFLSPSAPAGSGLLVVEGWIGKSELRSAIEVFRGGDYELLVTSGGPVFDWDEPYPTYAERAGDYLLRNGFPDDKLAVVPAPASAQDRTFLSAVKVRDWLAESGRDVDSLDLISSGPHTRRSWQLFRLAFGDGVRIGAIAAPSAEYDASAWWRTSVGARTLVSEAAAWVWSTCCFWPGPPGSHDEKWGIPAPE